MVGYSPRSRTRLSDFTFFTLFSLAVTLPLNRVGHRRGLEPEFLSVSCTGSRWNLYHLSPPGKQKPRNHSANSGPINWWWASSPGPDSYLGTISLGKFSSVQFSRSVMSDSLRPHKLQQARPPCPSSTPRVHPNSCPSSQWCHPTISSSVVPSSSCPYSFPASGSFQMSQLFASGGQSTGVSASASVLPMNTQAWSPLGWTGWVSLQSKGLSRVFSNTTLGK